LRDSYNRELARRKAENKSGSAAKSRKTYVFFEQLKFLEITVKKTTSSMGTDNHEDDNTSTVGSEIEDPTEEEFPTKRGKKEGKGKTRTCF